MKLFHKSHKGEENQMAAQQQPQMPKPKTPQEIEKQIQDEIAAAQAIIKAVEKLDPASKSKAIRVAETLMQQSGPYQPR